MRAVEYVYAFFQENFYSVLQQKQWSLDWTFVRATRGCVSHKQNQDTSVKTTSETRESTEKHLSLS